MFKILLPKKKTEVERSLWKQMRSLCVENESEKEDRAKFPIRGRNATKKSSTHLLNKEQTKAIKNLRSWRWLKSGVMTCLSATTGASFAYLESKCLPFVPISGNPELYAFLNALIFAYSGNKLYKYRRERKVARKLSSKNIVQDISCKLFESSKLQVDDFNIEKVTQFSQKIAYNAGKIPKEDPVYTLYNFVISLIIKNSEKIIKRKELSNKEDFALFVDNIFLSKMIYDFENKSSAHLNIFLLLFSIVFISSVGLSDFISLYKGDYSSLGSLIEKK